MWKACKDVLPTLSNMWKRKIIKEVECPICKRVPEIAEHVLWDCDATKDVWSQGCKRNQKMSGHRSSFLEIWSHMIKNLQQDELDEAVMTAGLIWFRRNLIHGKDFSHPDSLINKAREEIQIFKHSQERQHKKSDANEESCCLWKKKKKPHEGIYKLNWDATIDRAAGKISIGAIIWDSYGNLIGTLIAPHSLSANPFIAE
ncbi:hypothetical protein F2P56_001831 [Juglans regia]|uniref:Reverse transcriptase zinc-binding domain-containing protein n=2 Tax=Juglans regia TaxID=51240 RepID=A0A833YFK6_JUGRE|nr:uncharacterized protein LOC108991966 [Juglans regia]KAF5481155.1 hypothetical protein F2P56_001831 [Juglans regia]